MSDEVLSSSWCTAWQSYNTPRLWAMVADEDDPEAWRQVAAWGDISGSVQDQRALLVKAREDLVAAWPPEQNKSAAAFVQELDTLIGRMDAARADADETATGLANILEALRQAKNNIQPLYEQYKEKSGDLVPAWFDSAEDEIDEQARAHMITAEGIVQENVARLKVPEPYELNPEKPHFDQEPTRDDGRPSGVRGGPGATGSAGTGAGIGGAISVPHDPVPPMPGREPTIPDGVTGGPDPSRPGDGPTGGGPNGGGTGSVTPAGPSLAGVITPPGVPPVETLPPGSGPFPGGGGGGGPVTGGAGGPFPPGVVPPGQVGSGGPGRGATAASGGVGPGGAGRGGVRPVTGRALPSGAVIGETVAGGPRSAMGGVGGASGRGVAPGRSGVGGAGGVVGGGAGGVGSRAGAGGVGNVSGRPGAVTGRGGVAGQAGAARGAGQPRPPRPSWLPDEPANSGRGSAPMGASGGARGTRRAGDGSQPAFDPDNPWQVAEGVDPVIAPSTEEHTHDPGPNVIGWRG